MTRAPSSALDWIIPTHMSSRISTFKAAANEVKYSNSCPPHASTLHCSKLCLFLCCECPNFPFLFNFCSVFLISISLFHFASTPVSFIDIIIINLLFQGYEVHHCKQKFYCDSAKLIQTTRKQKSNQFQKLQSSFQKKNIFCALNLLPEGT